MNPETARKPIAPTPAAALPPTTTRTATPAVTPDPDPAPSSATLSSPEKATIDRMELAAREIGHDLNNCLGIVGGRAELILMYLDRGKGDKAREGADVILAQVERMRELSNAIRKLRDRD